MDEHAMVAIMWEALGKQLESHNTFDVRSREIDWYLKCYIEKIEEVIDEREEKNNE